MSLVRIIGLVSIGIGIVTGSFLLLKAQNRLTCSDAEVQNSLLQSVQGPFIDRIVDGVRTDVRKQAERNRSKEIQKADLVISQIKVKIQELEALVAVETKKCGDYIATHSDHEMVISAGRNGECPASYAGWVEAQEYHSTHIQPLLDQQNTLLRESDTVVDQLTEVLDAEEHVIGDRMRNDIKPALTLIRTKSINEKTERLECVAILKANLEGASPKEEDINYSVEKTSDGKTYVSVQ